MTIFSPGSDNREESADLPVCRHEDVRAAHQVEEMRAERTTAGLVIDVDSEAETDRLGRAIAALVAPGTVIGLVGPLGAGKTRLTRAIAEALDVDPEAIASPTFVLIHEYAGRLPVFHFDTYRLHRAEDFEALGVADYWDAGGVCLVEWADRVGGLLPDRSWMIRIEPATAEARRIAISWPAKADLADALERCLAAV